MDISHVSPIFLINYLFPYFYYVFSHITDNFLLVLLIWRLIYVLNGNYDIDWLITYFQFNLKFKTPKKLLLRWGNAS